MCPLRISFKSIPVLRGGRRKYSKSEAMGTEHRKISVRTLSCWNQSNAGSQFHEAAFHQVPLNWVKSASNRPLKIEAPGNNGTKRP